ncbi:MAG: hypothetical protein HYV36_06600 [Lentisphaerae bacterium]|nr:hypothetical protein [Lentisphaerota bacterium]
MSKIKRKACVLVLLAELMAALSLDAAKLGEGVNVNYRVPSVGARAPWKTFTKPAYTFKVSITGIPTIEWAGGTLELPYFCVQYDNDNRSPYWMQDNPVPRGDWESVLFQRTPGRGRDEALSLVGLYRGAAIYQTAILADTGMLYRTKWTGLYPPPSGNFEITGTANRLRKDQKLPFTATLRDGRTVTGDANKSFPAVAPIRELVLRGGHQRLRIEVLDVDRSGGMKFHNYGSPETHPLDAVTVACLTFEKLSDVALRVRVEPDVPSNAVTVSTNTP